MSVTPMWRWMTGTDSRSRKPTDSTASGIGRRMTAVTIRAHRPLPSSRSRPKYGTRPLFTRSPRIARVAGRNVRLPTIATKITPIVPTAIERNSDTSMRNSPAIEIMTAMPLKKTARPAVLLATSMASRISRPRRRSDRNLVIMNSE